MSDFKEERKTLLAQARALGLEVDGRWSVETLAEKIMEALDDVQAREAEEIRATSDTWVYCIRDCFLATEKHKAGAVIRAPKELYLRWKATGAARLADEDEIAGAA